MRILNESDVKEKIETPITTEIQEAKRARTATAAGLDPKALIDKMDTSTSQKKRFKFN